MLNSENDSTSIIDSYSGCGRPHTAYPTAKMEAKLKILHWFYRSVCLAYQVFIFYQKAS